MTKDRVKLYAWFLKPKNNNPVFLFFHGQAESILSHQDVAQFCLDNGFGLFLLSYRGHYKSGGQPTEKGTYIDAEAAINHLKTLGVNEDRIILWGHSYGTVVAVETALNYNIKAVILQSAIKNFKTAIIDVVAFVLHRYNLDFIKTFFLQKVENLSLISKLDNISKIADIKKPMLIVHAKADCIAPYTNSVELASKNNNSKLVITNSGSHWKSHWCFENIFEFVNSLDYNETVNTKQDKG